MADTEQRLEIQVELHQPPSKEADAKSKELIDYHNTQEKDNGGDTEEPKPKANDAEVEAKDNDADEFPPPQLSEATLRMRSVHQQLRVVVDDLFTTETEKDKQASMDKLDIHHDSSFINRQVSSILIDEINNDTQEFETTVIALPQSPICAFLLMESIGTFEQLDRVNQRSIIASILVTIFAQLFAGGTLFWKQLHEETISTEYLWSDCWINMTIISFIVVYLSQDTSQTYKMVVLLRWMRRARKLRRFSAAMIGLYLMTNFVLYVFLLYYSIVQLLIQTGDVVPKLQAAVAVYFILEVDDWLHDVTIEPLKILDDEIFNLHIRGSVGSRNKRLRHVTFCFWGVFVLILVIQFTLFVTRAQHYLTLT